MRCPSCNSRIPDDSVICPECGKKIKKKYKRKKRSSNGLVVLIVFLCLLLLVGFILVASRLILKKDTRRPPQQEVPAREEVKTGDDTLSAEPVISGEETQAPAREEEAELSGTSLIPADTSEDLTEGPAADQTVPGLPATEGSAADQTVPGVPATEGSSADQTVPGVPATEGTAADQSAADYDLSGKKIYTVFGTMSSHGITKELLLEEPKSFYGKDTTGATLFLKDVESISFASSNSKVSIQELRAIPDGTSLQCEGSMYIHDNKVFLRLENLTWQSINEGE